jgi:hypothetical protein
MSLSEPILTGPGGGRTFAYGEGSSAELKIAGEQSGGDWADSTDGDHVMFMRSGRA